MNEVEKSLNSPRNMAEALWRTEKHVERKEADERSEETKTGDEQMPKSLNCKTQMHFDDCEVESSLLLRSETHKHRRQVQPDEICLRFVWLQADHHKHVNIFARTSRQVRL